MFGDLTTVSLSYKRGWNHVFRNIKDPDGGKIRDPTFRAADGYARLHARASRRSSRAT